MKNVNRTHLLLLYVCTIILLTVNLCHAGAQDFRFQQRASWESITLKNQELTSIAEDIMIINGQPYQFSGKTKIFIPGYDGGPPVKISPRDISMPSQCDIIFKQYTSSDEAHPYKGTKNIIETVKIKQ